MTSRRLLASCRISVSVMPSHRYSVFSSPAGCRTAGPPATGAASAEATVAGRAGREGAECRKRPKDIRRRLWTLEHVDVFEVALDARSASRAERCRLPSCRILARHRARTASRGPAGSRVRARDLIVRCDRVERLLGGGTREQALAGEHLVTDDGECELIGRRHRPAFARLLRRHVATVPTSAPRVSTRSRPPRHPGGTRAAGSRCRSRALDPSLGDT